MGKSFYLWTIFMVFCANSVLADVSSNETKPVIFLSSPPESSNISDSGSSASGINEEIIPERPVYSPTTNVGQKPAVSSQGYQLEVIQDRTSEEAQERSDRNSQKASERQIHVYPSGSPEETPSLIDQYLHQAEYDDNSAKEDNNDYHSKGGLSYDDLSQKSDISKVRDAFVGKEVHDEKHAHRTDAYPSASPQESKFKLEYGSPLNFVSSPILLKESSLPLNQPLSLSLPHSHLHHHDEVSGHTAGYGHGFHHHQQKLKTKPLKPSVVYRDPTDSFDHHDKLRTLDKDHLEKGLHHTYGPHHGHHKGHDYHSYQHGKVHFKPEYYDQTKIPECAHKNKFIYNLTFCLDDPHYPTETIIWALKEERHHAKKLLSDVTYQSADNLVTGLTRAEEEGYTYKHYFGATHEHNVHLEKYKPPYQGYTYSTDYFKKGGYICPSDIYYARPKRAMNTYGKWKVIVNVDHVPDHGYSKYGHGHSHGYGHHHHHGKPVDIGHGIGIYKKDPYHHHEKHHPHPHHDEHHHQHHHDKEVPHPHHEGHHHHGDPHHNDFHHDQHGYGGESYAPHSIKKREYKEKKSYTQTLRLEQCIYAGAPCSYIDSHFHSKCIQKHNFVRLVAWTKDEGIHVDTFKLPIA